MPRDLSKREIGALQDAMVFIQQTTGQRPTVLLVHPMFQAEFGVSLSLFGMDHGVEIRVEPRLMPPTMVFGNPLRESREPWQG